jgi:hypothetical protein
VASVAVAVRDPAARFLGCPFRASTGLWCPGCGATRALHALLRGDVAGMASQNALLPLFLLGTGLLWLTWWRSARGRPAPAWWGRTPPAVWVWLGGLVIAFGVLRNLPLQPFAAMAPDG